MSRASRSTSNQSSTTASGRAKVPVRSTRDGVLYVPYAAAVFSREKLRRIAADVIAEAQKEKPTG